MIDNILIATGSFSQSGLSLSSEGVLGPFASDLPEEGLDMTDIPPAED